jgi:hypothetical protein
MEEGNPIGKGAVPNGFPLTTISLGDFAILAPKLLDPFLPYHKVGTSPFVGSPQRGT